MISLQTTSTAQAHVCGCTQQSRLARRGFRSVRKLRSVQVLAQARRAQDQGALSQGQTGGPAMKVLTALAAAQLAFSGAAFADLSQPILPGADITNKDLPDGPKLGDALKGVGGEGIADKAKSAVGSASDKAGEKTPDVNVPGFGPFKFNPKEDAKQAQKKSPLGFLQANRLVVADLPSLPGQNVKKSDLPDGPKPGQSLPTPQGPGGIGKAVSKASDKAGEATPTVNIPGFGPFKGNPKEDAKQAQKKVKEATSSISSAPGYELASADQANMLVLGFDLSNLPGANVKKEDLPDGPKFPIGDANPADKAAQVASKASDRAGEATPDVEVPGFDVGDAKDNIQQAVNKRGLE